MHRFSIVTNSHKEGPRRAYLEGDLFLMEKHDGFLPSGRFLFCVSQVLKGLEPTCGVTTRLGKLHLWQFVPSHSGRIYGGVPLK